MSCGNHNNPKLWKDEPKGSQIRTTCVKCGKFIGYRPKAK